MTKILIMEDNVQLALEWQSVFELNQFDVVVEHEGAAAIRRLEKEEFDLVITDLIVPKGRGGLSVITKLLSMRGRAPASIVITGARNVPGENPTENHFLRQARKLGANVTLQKPVQAAEVVAVARDVLAYRDRLD